MPSAARSSVAGIADVADDALDRQPGEVVVGSARLAQRPDRVAGAEERPHDRRTDEPGRAGDEDRLGSAPVSGISPVSSV